MTLAIEKSDSLPASVLLVNLGISRPDGWIAAHQTSVTPFVVRRIIWRALAAGWNTSEGGIFHFEHQLIQDTDWGE